MQLLVLYLIGGFGIPGHQNGVTWGRTGGAANPQLLCRGFERTWQEGQEASPAELALLGICALILRILYIYEFLEIYEVLGKDAQHKSCCCPPRLYLIVEYPMFGEAFSSAKQWYTPVIKLSCSCEVTCLCIIVQSTYSSGTGLCCVSGSNVLSLLSDETT